MTFMLELKGLKSVRDIRLLKKLPTFPVAM